MANYVSRDDVPAPIIGAINDPYYNEEMADHWASLPDDIRTRYKENHYSATTLIRGPRERLLQARHGHKVLLDPLTAMWRLFGHTIHEILRKHGTRSEEMKRLLKIREAIVLMSELGIESEELIKEHVRSLRVMCLFGDTSDLIEHRLGVEIGGTYVHGQCDRYSPSESRIQDWKITSTYTLKHDDRDTYVAQQNILAWIFRENGLPVEEISLVYIFRDWSRAMVGTSPWYPEEQVCVSVVPVWSHEECLKYIWDRVQKHNAANDMDDDDLPYCTDEERWLSAPVYKAFKAEGKDPKTGELVLQKRAKHVSPSSLECTDWIVEEIESMKRAHEERETKRIGKLKNPEKAARKAFDPPTFEVKTIPGRPIKCGFCEISDFCGQIKEWNAANATDATDEDDNS